MKSKHSIKSLGQSEIVLDDGTAWTIGPMESIIMWSFMDRVELDDQGQFSTIFNLSNKKTVRVCKSLDYRTLLKK